jgi:hypothetical protein
MSLNILEAGPNNDNLAEMKREGKDNCMSAGDD